MAFYLPHLRHTILHGEIVFYDLTKSHKSNVEQSLISFRSELKKHIQDFDRLKIRYGNDEYPDTFESLEATIVPLIKNGQFSTAKALHTLWKNKKVSQNENFWGNLNLIILPDSSIYFKEIPGAHGIQTDCQFAFLKECYLNIIWHETAHLFGAEDHYVKGNEYRMISECSDPDNCLMQWDPADKDVVFCSKTLEEIRNYLNGTGR